MASRRTSDEASEGSWKVDIKSYVQPEVSIHRSFTQISHRSAMRTYMCSKAEN